MAKRKTLPKASELDIKEEYARARARYEALRQEVVFILETSLASDSIKIHQVESRVKEFQSIADNISNNKYSTLSEVKDVVGARVVCLFKSDLNGIIDIIRTSFDVINIDNKIESVDDVFGYMSIHVTCRMKDKYTGPRYDQIGDQEFEIQVRTLCMHAWAAISHYLDYKAEWDIPDHLRKGLNALSGLFYVADNQYEQIYNNRQSSKESVQGKSKNDIKDQTLNYDTVYVMLRRLFPNRKEASSDKISLFVKELIDNEYKDIGSVEGQIVSELDHVEKRDAQVKRDQKVVRAGPFFADLGAARIALKKANGHYKQVNMSGGAIA